MTTSPIKPMIFEWSPRYAELIATAGVRVEKNQNLAIRTETSNLPFAQLVAEAAYGRGARFVDIDVIYNPLTRSRLDKSTQENLSYLPNYVKGKFDEMAQEDWAVVNIFGPDFPDIFNDVDQSRNALIQKSAREATGTFRKKMIAHQLRWNIHAHPTLAWAQKVFPKAGSPELAMAEFEKLFVKILRLDQDDPIAHWKTLAEGLQGRAKKLSDLNFKKLRFDSSNTKLELELCSVSPWAGGGDPEKDFLPNIPTEEVFTSPDWRKTNGHVKVTRPVELLGSQVEGAEFTFKEGQVVDYKASKGKELLDAFFSIDERGKYLGEVALVGKESPIYQSGRIFESILFDENAACHIALGAAYPLGVEDKNYEEEKLLELGLNQSILHTDFMIGSDDMNVTGIQENGKSVAIMEEGSFCREFDL